MFDQVTTSCGRPANLNRLDKTSIIFEQAIDGFFHELRCIFTCASGKMLQTGFLIRR